MSNGAISRLERAHEPDQLVISLNAGDLARRAVVASGEYFQAVGAAGLHFFEHLERLIPGATKVTGPEVKTLRSWLT